ncbi:MAG: hypothetical protein E7246_09310 [Lachnoclostridium sp.]|nr:hypothetical protein [Lachnoclostridium sp.]
MEKKKEEMRAEKKHFPVAGVAAAVIILTAGGGFGVYASKAAAYNDAFLPNTTINGMDVSGKGIEEVKAMIEEEISGYEIAVLERTEAGETIRKDEIGLRSVFDGSLEMIIAEQEPWKWITALWTPASYEIDTMLVCDEAMLAERIRALACMNPENMIEPQDAYLTGYQSATASYEIVDAVEGTELVESQVYRAVADAVMLLSEEVDLDAAGCYTKPAKYADDPELVTLANELNLYVGAAVNHTFGDTKEVLNGDTIHKWLTVDGTTVTLDESQITKYVRALAKKYNTAYGSRKMQTSYGVEVTVPAGPYGWRMNESKEAAEILEVIRSGNQVTREPEWLQRGASHGKYDYGDTYVEVNLTAQHMFFYKDGELIVEADFVSGKSSKGWDTPAGAYPLTYKQRNATLRGEDYETPVAYWMPFNGNIGLHDADWRASFGGTLYKNNGSHGCVNLPPKAAQLVYENISAGDPVLCYHLEGTESNTTTKASEVKVGGSPSVTKPVETKPAETKPVETKPVETTAAPTTEAPTEAPETSPVPETAEPETAEPETSPAIEPTEPETQAPSQPQIPQGVTEPSTSAQIPQGATSAQPEGVNGPGAVEPDYSAGPGATAGSTEADSFGPGMLTETQSVNPMGPGGPGV